MKPRSFQTLLDERTDLVVRLRERVLNSWNVDAVHDLRVATRRLQEVLDFCAPWLNRPLSLRLGRRARAIRRVLGDLRNADVHEQLLAAFSREVGASLRKPARDLRRQIAARGAALRAAGRLGALRIPAIEKRAEALRGALDLPSGPVPSERARLVVGRRGRAIMDSLPRAMSGDPAALHRLRIVFKRWRYALEILEAIHFSTGFPLAPALKSAREMQTTLGLLHDLDVLIDLVGSQAGPGRAGLLSCLRVSRRESLPQLLDQLQSFQLPATPRRAAAHGLTA